MVYSPNTSKDRQEMLSSIGLKSIDDLFQDVPKEMRKFETNLPEPMSEMEVRAHMQGLAKKNADMSEYSSFLGAGAYQHYIPAAVDEIIRKSELYTAYTPYQAESSQGVLQSIYEYQTLVARLLEMDVANASMYDAGTALYEAAIMALRSSKKRSEVIVDTSVHPEHRNVINSYFHSTEKFKMGLVDHDNGRTNIAEIEKMLSDKVAAVIVQTPNFFGTVEDFTALAEKVHAAGAMLIISVNPISLGVLKSPGAMGADIVVAEGQPLGLALNYGGPYLGMLAVKEKFIRTLPGRIIGTTVDKDGNRGFVMTLQTREQHIRREKATSNICTNEALCALAASVYMSLMGKQGIREVGELNMKKTAYAMSEIASKTKCSIRGKNSVFNEFVVECPVPAAEVLAALKKEKIIGGFDLSRYYIGMENCILVAVTEVNRKEDIDRLVSALAAF